MFYQQNIGSKNIARIVIINLHIIHIPTFYYTYFCLYKITQHEYNIGLYLQDPCNKTLFGLMYIK